jgi:alpha-1,6-mannosyltransferase
VSEASFRAVAHAVGPLIAVVICVWALRHLPTIGLPRVMGIGLLALVLLGPIVQPWYLLWGVVVIAITAGPRTSAAIALLSVSVSVLGVVGLGQLGSEWVSLPFLCQLLIVLVLGAAIVVPVCSTSQEGGRTTEAMRVMPLNRRPFRHLQHA